MSIQLTPEQAAVVHNRGGELLVSAAAGSGKTRVLVERLLERVDEGLDLDHFLVITFTRAAAAELRQKILDALHQKMAQRPEDRHLRRQTTLVYRTQISTIHAFCTVLLRESSHLLDLDPDFRVADETESDLLKLQVLDRLLERHYEQLDDDFAGLMDAFSAGRDDEKLRAMVLDIHKKVQSHADPERWLREQAACFDLSGIHDAGETKWGQLLLKDAAEQIQYWHSQMCLVLDLLRGDEVLQRNYAESICQTMDDMDNFLSAVDRGWDSARALCGIRYPRPGAKRGTQDLALRDQVKAMRANCKKRTDALAKRFNASSAELLEDMETVRGPVQTLFRLVQEFQEAFQAAKKRRKLVDFSDLEHLTAAALLDKDGQPTELARRWQSRYAEVMVDEYQDTNAVQNAIFDALTDEGKNLFQVGDVKQSIYRFRLADPTIFLKKYHTFHPASEAGEGQARKLVLSRNFRSRESVLSAVNFVFEHLMTRDFGELDYTADQRLHPGRNFPENPEDKTELDVVDCGAIEQEENQAKLPKDLVEARFVAKRIHGLLTEPYLVSDGDALRPARPEDIVILYRAPGSVLRYLTPALDEWGIPWQLESAGDCYSTTEVQTAVSFLRIVDNPRQDVPLISVLRSPVYGFTGDDLAMLRARCKEGDFYDCVCAGGERGEEKCLRFLDDLALLRTRMPDCTCARLLWTIYDDLGLRSLVGAMPGGQRRQENLLAFYDYVRSFEGGAHRGVFALVTELRRLEEAGKTPLLSTASHGSGVSIMSIHKSKGLEFPVVVLAGLSRNFNKMDEMQPMLFHSGLGIGPKGLDTKLRMEYPTLARSAVKLQLDREMKAEELRLLYVAMTRAQEKLIMVMSFSDAEKSLSRLVDAAGPHPEPQALLQQTSIGNCLLLCVLARHDAAELCCGKDVEEHALVEDRWNIRLVRADHTVFGPETLQSQREQTVEEEVQVSPKAEQFLWRYPWEQLADLPSKVTATQLKGRTLDDEAAEETVPPPKPIEFRRPDFIQRERGLTRPQRGTAVHAVMQLIELDKACSVNTVREEIARLVEGAWLTPEQGKAVPPEMIADFWSSPLGQEALRHRDTLRREQKFSILTEAQNCFPEAPSGEQVLLQGVIDCCFETEDGLTIIDFKTDRIRPGGEQVRAEEYRTQLEVYTAALEQITGKRAARRCVWFLHTGRGVDLS